MRRRATITSLSIAACLALTALGTLPVTASAGSRLVHTTVDHGIRLRIDVPAGPWHHDQLVRGTVRVKNTNDRTAWYLDIACGDVGVAARVPTSPERGASFAGDLAEFKRLALSYRKDVGPVVGRFRVEGAGDCAEPDAEALPAGATRTYDVSWRVEDVVRGMKAVDISAAFQFEGFKRSRATWTDRAPRPISASVRVPLTARQGVVLSPVTAIDIGLHRDSVRRDIRATDRDGWSDVEMELRERKGRWRWDVRLWGAPEPGANQTVLVSFSVDAGPVG